MLEVKNLVKCYSTRGGVTVKALDDVSVTFPETGMVFLLGRSGSGKSTLLNVSGGLDKPDSGEIIVKGRSSKEFSGADFDSYRNTFVGFIFQEYNILNEFTVEQNIALALQLQSKPCKKEDVEKLLEQVDLKGLGKRKPNTLSGGQKQRVAIARALIKEPEIIMADEPTGALDSKTGKQVFDTLKKLSETKLIIVVSHDRDFAEQYGDRIIELKDGKIISDVSKAVSDVERISENVEVVSSDTISIKKAEDITEADVKSIVKILKANGGEAIITAGKRELPNVKRACRINDSGTKEYFKDTTNVDSKKYDGKSTKFIKSKLPASHAFKMGVSGLKTKPIRLLFTILLSIVAFVMFGVVSTFMLYDQSFTLSEALKEADYPNITIEKQYDTLYQSIRIDNETDEEEITYEDEQTRRTRFGVKELADKNASVPNKFAGVFNFTNKSDTYGEGNQYSFMIDDKTVAVNSDYYPVKTIFGFTDCGAEYMSANGFNFINSGSNRYPIDKTEVAISKYVASLFVGDEPDIHGVEKVLGKKLKFTNVDAIPSNTEFTVVGIYDFGEIPSKYNELKDSTSNNLSPDEKKDLKDSLTDYLTNSFNTLIYVSNDFYDEYKEGIRTENYGSEVQSKWVQGVKFSNYEITENLQEYDSESVFTEKIWNKNQSSFKLYAFSDLENELTTLSLNENEAYISYNKYNDTYVRPKVESCIWNMANNESSKVDFAHTLGCDIEEGSDFREVSNNIYMEGNMEKAFGYVSAYYSDLMYRNYIYNTAFSMKNIANIGGVYSEYNDLSTFGQAVNKFSLYINWFNTDMSETAPAEPTQADFEILEEKVLLEAIANNTEKPRFSQLYYYRLAGDITQAAGRNGKDYGAIMDMLNSNLTEITFDGALWDLASGNLNEANFAEIKTVIDNNYLSIIGHEILAPSQAFVPDLSVDNIKLYYKDFMGNSGELKVVGLFDAGEYGAGYLVNSNFVKTHQNLNSNNSGDYTYSSKYTSDYVEPEDAKYNFLITKTDNSQDDIAFILQTESGTTLKIKNQIASNLDMFLEIITDMQQVFLIIGIVMGVFSGLMLLNFISVSISAKKKDIGILRAVGSRGSDVFKIFFSEALIIALICFVLATVGAYFVCGLLNTSLVEMINNMKLLDFGIINVGLIFAVSMGISFLATFFPVLMAAKKPPVESIRAL